MLTHSEGIYCCVNQVFLMKIALLVSLLTRSEVIHCCVNQVFLMKSHITSKHANTFRSDILLCESSISTRELVSMLTRSEVIYCCVNRVFLMKIT